MYETQYCLEKGERGRRKKNRNVQEQIQSLWTPSMYMNEKFSCWRTLFSFHRRTKGGSDTQGLAYDDITGFGGEVFCAQESLELSLVFSERGFSLPAWLAQSSWFLKSCWPKIYDLNILKKKKKPFPFRILQISIPLAWKKKNDVYLVARPSPVSFSYFHNLLMLLLDLDTRGEETHHRCLIKRRFKDLRRQTAQGPCDARAGS